MMADERHPLVCCQDCQLDDDVPHLEGLKHMNELQDHRHHCLFDYIEPLANGCFRLGQCWRHYSAMCPLGETFFTLDPLPDKETEWEVWKTTMDFPSEPRGYRLVLLTLEYELWVQSDGVISAHKPGELRRAIESAQGRRKRARVCGPHEIATRIQLIRQLSGTPSGSRCGSHAPPIIHPPSFPTGVVSVASNIVTVVPSSPLSVLSDPPPGTPVSAFPSARANASSEEQIDKGIMTDDVSGLPRIS